MLFSYDSGQQQIGNNKKCKRITVAISIAMRMWWYDAGHITQ